MHIGTLNPSDDSFSLIHGEEPSGLRPLRRSKFARGSYRSDVCRAAVLAREGGFYTDLDVATWSEPALTDCK